MLLHSSAVPAKLTAESREQFLNAPSLSSVTLLGIVMLSSDVQFKKDEVLMLVRVSGRITLLRLVQPSKVEFSEVVPEGTVTLSSAVQPLKAPEESLPVFGKEIFLSEVHPENPPIHSISEGNSTCSREVHPLNALLIFVRLSGIFTERRLMQLSNA